MPLPGGPSDKLGNRYELRWVVRKFVEVLSGRLVWIRIEPPGEDAIEFKCLTLSGKTEVWQVKRGHASAGRWTIAALTEVLRDFGVLIKASPTINCVFASEHSAWELSELTERARDALDIDEFTQKFLISERLQAAWNYLLTLWRVDNLLAWSMLRQIKSTTVSESELISYLDSILQELLDGPPINSRAILTQIALEAVHQEINAEKIKERLAASGINLFPSRKRDCFSANIIPPASGIRRESMLQQIVDAIANRKPTVLIGGIPGIGKSTIAAQFASEWTGSVCWLDAGLIGTTTEALTHIGQYLKDEKNDARILDYLSRDSYSIDSITKLAGRLLASHGCLLVWDGVEQRIASVLISTINIIADNISGGAQLVTATNQGAFHETPASAGVHVERLDPMDARTLILEAYPNARLPDLEAGESVTNGHPYLIRLLCGAAQTIDLRSAIELFRNGHRNADAVITDLLRTLPDNLRKLLIRLTLRRLPFDIRFVTALGFSLEDLQALSSRYLVIRYGTERYRVHSIIMRLIQGSAEPDEAKNVHGELAMLLARIDDPTWTDLRALLMHATKANMVDLQKKAAILLLRFSFENGYWKLAKEAAKRLVETSNGNDESQFYAHWILGKIARLHGELELAIKEYKLAEKAANSWMEIELTQCELAAVLMLTDQEEEGASIFRNLAQSSSPKTKTAALHGLGLWAVRRGTFDAAISMIEEAQRIAKDAKLLREEAEGHQALAEILLKNNQLEEARTNLRRAHQLRLSIDPEARVLDIYGWYFLFRMAIKIERQIGNADDLASAAHSCWRFAVLSGNVIWEVEAAQYLCDADDNLDDPEVVASIRRLRSKADDTELASEERLIVLDGLVLCSWRLDLFSDAFEAILDTLAISTEFNLQTTAYAHLPRSHLKTKEKILAFPEGTGFILTLPDGMGIEEITEMVSVILSRRPELTQYAQMIIGEKKNTDQSESSE